MTRDQFKALKPGDLVRNTGSSSAYIVHANYGDRVTAAKTVDLTNPSEWLLVRPDSSVIADYTKDGYYWFKSERATDRSIAQRVNGEWFTVNEQGPITLEELIHRGWHIDEAV